MLPPKYPICLSRNCQSGFPQYAHLNKEQTGKQCPECGQPLYQVAQQRQEHRQEQESSAILGIGGIGIYADNEMPIVPSERAIARLERMEKRATYCRRCGQSDVFDGAMFTTLGGTNICDDCA